MRPFFVLAATALGLSGLLAAGVHRTPSDPLPVRIPAEIQIAIANAQAMPIRTEAGTGNGAFVPALYAPSIQITVGTQGELMLTDEAGRWIVVRDPQQLIDALRGAGLRPMPIGS